MNTIMVQLMVTLNDPNTFKSSRLLSSLHPLAIQYLCSGEARACAHKGPPPESRIGSMVPSERVERTSSMEREENKGFQSRSMARRRWVWQRGANSARKA